MPEPITLKRSLGLTLLVLYGLGTTIGAGIYALTGEVAAAAGSLAPVAFLVASVLAGFTALSFAEMCSRFPRAAGEAVYVAEGLRARWLGTLVGLLVTLAACVSSAAIISSFVGYLDQFIVLPPTPVLIGLAILLALLAAWGITESVIMAALFTLVEIGGLVLVIWAARGSFGELPLWMHELTTPSAGGLVLPGVLSASLLAFYAFLGFEDMVNVAEEVRDVRRVMPQAILITLVFTAILYVLLATAAVLTVSPAELGASGAPLALIYERATGQSSSMVAGIALFAVVNGALIQVILASRVLYGLACQQALPCWLGRLNPHTRTPVRATALVATVVAVLSLWFPLARLAEATSTITLLVFTLVNLALWRLKRRVPVTSGAWHAPYWLPVAGFWTSLGFVLFGIAHFVEVGFR